MKIDESVEEPMMERADTIRKECGEDGEDDQERKRATMMDDQRQTPMPG